jgi:hypothetical protein
MLPALFPSLKQHWSLLQTLSWRKAYFLELIGELYDMYPK